MVLTPEGAGILRDLSWQLAVDQRDRRDAAAPADRRRRVDRLARPVAALPRAVGLPDGPGLHLREGLRLGAARVPAGRGADRAAAGAVRRGEVARRRRVRPLARATASTSPTPASTASCASSRSTRRSATATPRQLGGLVKVTAPPGVHIIDHVSRDWLWRQPRPLVQALAARLAEGARAAVTHPLDDLRLPGPTLVLVDDSDSLALDALHGIEDVPGIEPQVVTLSALSGPLKGWGSVLVVAADRVAAAADGERRTPAGAVQGRRLLAHRRAHPVGARAAAGVAAAGAPALAREAGDRGVLTVAPLRLRRPRPAGRDGDGPPGGRTRRHHPRRARRVRTPDAPPRPASTPAACCCPTSPGAGDAERDVPPDVVVAGRGRRRSPRTTSSTGRRPSSPTPAPSRWTSGSSTPSASARTGTTPSSTSPGSAAGR